MIQQIRFYGKDSQDNYPEKTNLQSLRTGEIFNSFIPILSIGVQGLPGTKFYINGSQNPVILGYSGIYELKLEQSFPIKQLQFDLESLNIITENPNGYLIIDLLYEEDQK